MAKDNPWDKDKAYPMKTTTCDVCQEVGLMKLGWDRQRWLCIQPGPCMRRFQAANQE